MERKEMDFNEPVQDTRKEMDYGPDKKPIDNYVSKDKTEVYYKGKNVGGFTMGRDKDGNGTTIEKHKPEFTSKDYGNVRVYPNETGSNMDKNNKWIGKRYSLMEAHKLDDNYLKNNLVGKTKSGSDIYKMPDGYFSGNPRINAASFKSVQDLEDFEKKSGEHRAAMKEGTYLDDYIKNYKQPETSNHSSKFDELIKHAHNTFEPEYRGAKAAEGFIQDYEFGNMDENYDSNKNYKLTDDEKSYITEQFKKLRPDYSDLTDDELKEELYDNQYWYGNAKTVDEVAKALVDRTHISPERAKEFASKYWKGDETWSTKAPTEEDEDYEITMKQLKDDIRNLDQSGILKNYDVYEIADHLNDKDVDYWFSRQMIEKALKQYLEEEEPGASERNMSKAESFLHTNDNLNRRIKEENIDINLLISKLDNYRTSGDVRAIVDGDVGNFNGLSNGEIMDILDNLGYDYEIRQSAKGKTIYYIPRKK